MTTRLHHCYRASSRFPTVVRNSPFYPKFDETPLSRISIRPRCLKAPQLNQSGGDNPQSIYEGELTIGVTYFINGGAILDGCDFTNVGAPNNNQGTYFVASGTTPNWNGTTNPDMLTYNTGAPVATVLENTIGNIWFTYEGDGTYVCNSNRLFSSNKTAGFITYNDGGPSSLTDKPFLSVYPVNDYIVYVNSALDGLGSNDVLTNATIEIRVYN